jgi:hypothetical protein
MSTKNSDEHKPKSKVIEHEVEGGLSGAVAGAVFGAMAGPPGIAAGAIIGAVAGALTGGALTEGQAAEADRASELDEEIGVTSGTLGAPNLRHPPARRGAYSAASAQGGAAEGAAVTPAEGGMTAPEEED